MDWICLYETSVDFKLPDFLETMNLFITDPQHVSPFILRGEIISDSITLTKRAVKRKIVPRSLLDAEYVQDIVIEDGCARHEIDYPIDLYPFTYPKVKSFQFRFSGSSLYTEIKLDVGYPDLANDLKTKKVFGKLHALIQRFSNGFANGYTKKVYHDTKVVKSEFQDLYSILKNRYKHWIDLWDGLDPSKHVFEDISIAVWFILLWRQDKVSKKKYKFVDAGCGNGFLVYILVSEGFKGIGIDMTYRKQWARFDNSKDYLFVNSISSGDMYDCDWIIGNHADELTMWIPLLAYQNDCKFAIIPCCLFLLDGTRYTGLVKDLGRYASYIGILKSFINDIGYSVEEEKLRIPSTKNLCIFSRSPKNMECLELVGKHSSTVTKLRTSDRDKTMKFFRKKVEREQILILKKTDSLATTTQDISSLQITQDISSLQIA